MREALASLGVELDVIAGLEPDAALGNGGLGRLAACFMESMATVDVPAHGYGIRYANGMFRQEISDGWQVELPETWLDHGNPWEFERRERSFEVGFGGHVESVDLTARPARAPCLEADRARPGGRLRHAGGRLARQARQHAAAVVGAWPIDPILLDAFNAGDHIGALRESNKAEALARVLYPADSHQAGQELRLRQEYFFSTASLQDILQRHLSQFGDLTVAARQGGDPSQRHPSGDRRRRTDAAADGRPRHRLRRRPGTSPSGTFAYTNHTLLPEALESWPVPLFERLLPRHMQIIYAINAAGAAGGARRRRASPTSRSPHLADPGRWRPARAHGQSGLRRLAQHQRRVGAAYRTDEGNGLCRPAQALSRPHQQQDQRHHAAALADPVQSRPDRAGARGDRRRLPRRHRRADQELDAFAEDAAFPREVRRASSAPTRSGWPTSSPSGSASRSIRRRCSTSRSSASTNTSASCSTSSRRSRSTTRSAPIRSATGCRGSSSSAARRRRATTTPS